MLICMVLLSEVKYETSIGRLEDLSPESVISMLREVKADIGRLDSSFADSDLARVLAVVEEGKYKVNGNVSTHVDLLSARSVIYTYRKYSEGGCQSCVNLGREVIDAEDASVGLYCKKLDPDYDADAIEGPRVRYEGSSPKIRTHYDKPCGADWKPKFFPKLEVLVAKEQ